MSRSKLATIQLNPMLYLFISCVPLFLLSQSLTHKLLSIWFCGEFSRFLLLWFGQMTAVVSPPSHVRKPITASLASLRKMTHRSTSVVAEVEAENAEERERPVSLLDLPDLALDHIFERLSPTGLRAMAGVCSSLRERCTSDHLWERHLRQKWGSVIGDAARREWRRESASDDKRNGASEAEKMLKGSLLSLLFEFVVNSRLLSWLVPSEDKVRKVRTDLPADSIMALYLSFESGKFWFPAQVYNRENGHIGFMLSCYDAHLCYDSNTDTFEARYSPNGRRTTEDNIEWDRLRAPPLGTDPFVLHSSDCLQALKPGHHVEIQWRRNKDFPYGWWYGVVAHLETCDGDENRCRCHSNESVVLEFKQYNPGSRWRRTMVNRKDHREEGNEVDGFYGGIRKLDNAEEIAKWIQFWPKQVLEQ